MVKQLLVIGILSLLLSSCMSTQRYSTFVNAKTTEEKGEVEDYDDWLVIKTDITEPSKNTFTQKKKFFIPAILYWRWNSTIECELDIDTRLDYLKQGIYNAADSLNLKQSLADSKLEIEIKELPGKFLYENRGTALIFLVAYSMTSLEAISPYPINLEFDFSVSQDESLVMKGSGYVENAEQPIRNIWKSTKKFTWYYFDEFKKEANRMGTEMVIGILEELNKNDN